MLFSVPLMRTGKDISCSFEQIALKLRVEVVVLDMCRGKCSNVDQAEARAKIRKQDKLVVVLP